MKILTRHQEREKALQYLYALEIQDKITVGCLPQDINYPETLFEGESSDNYHLELIKGVCQELERLDQIISEKAINWRISRLAAVDKNILRIAIYEILFLEDIPKAVSINEAVELAKSYGSDKSYSFINGILGKVET